MWRRVGWATVLTAAARQAPRTNARVLLKPRAVPLTRPFSSTPFRTCAANPPAEVEGAVDDAALVDNGGHDVDSFWDEGISAGEWEDRNVVKFVKPKSYESDVEGPIEHGKEYTVIPLVGDASGLIAQIKGKNCRIRISPEHIFPDFHDIYSMNPEKGLDDLAALLKDRGTINVRAYNTEVDTNVPSGKKPLDEIDMMYLNFLRRRGMAAELLHHSGRTPTEDVVEALGARSEAEEVYAKRAEADPKGYPALPPPLEGPFAFSMIGLAQPWYRKCRGCSRKADAPVYHPPEEFPTYKSSKRVCRECFQCRFERTGVDRYDGPRFMRFDDLQDLDNASHVPVWEGKMNVEAEARALDKGAILEDESLLSEDHSAWEEKRGPPVASVVDSAAAAELPNSRFWTHVMEKKEGMPWDDTEDTDVSFGDEVDLQNYLVSYNNVPDYINEGYKTPAPLTHLSQVRKRTADECVRVETRRYLYAGGKNYHTGDKKVVVTVPVSKLRVRGHPLPDKARETLLQLVGTRYDHKKDMLRLVGNSFHSVLENKELVLEQLNDLIATATGVPDPQFSLHPDEHLRTRYYKRADKPPTVDEWRTFINTRRVKPPKYDLDGPDVLDESELADVQPGMRRVLKAKRGWTTLYDDLKSAKPVRG